MTTLNRSSGARVAFIWPATLRAWHANLPLVFPLSDHSIAVSLQDITDAVAASEALRRQALFDGLTGLPNRRLFDQELNRSLRDAPLRDERVALLVMDLDQFKEWSGAVCG